MVSRPASPHGLADTNQSSLALGEDNLEFAGDDVGLPQGKAADCREQGLLDPSRQSGHTPFIEVVLLAEVVAEGCMLS